MWQTNSAAGAVHRAVFIPPEDRLSVSRVFSVRMEKAANLSEFEKGQTVMTRHFGTLISETTHLVGYSHAAIVSMYQKWSKQQTTCVSSAAQ